MIIIVWLQGWFLLRLSVYAQHSYRDCVVLVDIATHTPVCTSAGSLRLALYYCICMKFGTVWDSIYGGNSTMLKMIQCWLFSSLSMMMLLDTTTSKLQYILSLTDYYSWCCSVLLAYLILFCFIMVLMVYIHIYRKSCDSRQHCNLWPGLQKSTMWVQKIPNFFVFALS